MQKYHNQEYIEKVVKEIKALSSGDRAFVVTEMQSYYEAAKDEYRHISVYSAPEEINRRIQSVYYYEDIFDALNITYKPLAYSYTHPTK